ncbi:MAG: tetratricopeptide repeat-containing sulfotransferase family protein [Rhizomicrobium sp.]
MPSLGLPPGLSESSPLGRLLAQARELIEQARFAEAIPLMTDAAALQPDHGRIHADLGGLYVETAQYAEALAPLRRALQINPRIGVAHWRLGVALQALGDPDGAISALEQAVQNRPDLTDAHMRLALLYEDQGRQHEAIESFGSAARAARDPAERQLFEAQALILETRADDAEPLLRSALALQPDLPAAHGLLARILSASGRFAEAGRHYEAQLARSPRAALLYYDLVRTRKITEADEHLLRRLDVAIEDREIGGINRAILLLARGKALSDLGRYEEAMKALDLAADLRAHAFSIDIEKFERQVDDVIALFDPETIARCGSDNSDRTPLLILGMPRSGTTLVEQIVCSHPAIVGGSELAYWRKRAAAALEAGAGGLNRPVLARSASEYLGLLRAISPTAARVTDKDPFNFLAIGLIHMTFPQAAIIHCRRTPVDAAISIHHTHFSSSTGLPTGGEGLVRYFRAYRRLMAHWRRVLPQGRLYELDYERLTQWPRSEIPRLIEHIGLAWDEACLSPHVNTRMVDTPSGWQVRQSINPGSVGRWRLYEPWLGPLAALVEDGEEE